MRPLEGIRVLDITIYQHGPYATTMLADLGAEVIKVENPRGGDPGRVAGHPKQGVRAYFLAHNRGKKSLALDLKHPRGKEAILELVKISDVVVTNYRYEAMRELGLSYADLCQINPKIIYATGSGFGPKGPWRARPALDIIGQAVGGIMSLTGGPDGVPTRVRVPQADQVGGMMLSYGVVVALFVRERTGVGQELHESLYGTQVALQAWDIIETLLPSQNQAPAGGARWGPFLPFWNPYLCADNRWIVLGMIQAERYWERVCKALGREDLLDNPLFATQAGRTEYAAELVAIISAVLSTRPSQEWLDILGRYDAICGPVNTYADVANDPQALENEYIVKYDHPIAGPIKMNGFPVEFSKTPANPYTRAPELGEHTAEVLQLVGCSPADIASMHEERIVFVGKAC